MLQTKIVSRATSFSSDANTNHMAAAVFFVHLFKMKFVAMVFVTLLFCAVSSRQVEGERMYTFKIKWFIAFHNNSFRFAM